MRQAQSADVENKGNPGLKEHTVDFGFFILCATWWKKMKKAALSDWLSMVWPSIWTKTFGRTLMVLNIIHFTTAADFILQNLMYAAWPIALISGTVVGAYRYFEARGAGKSKKESFSIAMSFFFKTAIKFFVVYMGWASAMALVNMLGWFTLPIAFPALVILGSSAGAFALLALMQWVLRKFNANEFLQNMVAILMVACVFTIVAAAFYYVSPLIMSLLVVGGITALSLFFASLVTDVLMDPSKDFSKAWGMLARAYSEGVVWALVEHIGLNVVVGGILGGVLDVFCVCTAVCLSIFFGGQIDEHFKHLKQNWACDIAKDKKATIVKELKLIKSEDKKVETHWQEIHVSIAKVRACLPEDGSIHLFDGYMKYEVGIKVLALLDVVVTTGEKAQKVDDLIPEKCWSYIRIKRMASVGPKKKESETYLIIQEATNVANRCLSNPSECNQQEWKQVKKKFEKRLLKMKGVTKAKMRFQYGVDVDEKPEVQKVSVGESQVGVFATTPPVVLGLGSRPEHSCGA